MASNHRFGKIQGYDEALALAKASRGLRAFEGRGFAWFEDWGSAASYLREVRTRLGKVFPYARILSDEGRDGRRCVSLSGSELRPRA